LGALCAPVQAETVNLDLDSYMGHLGQHKTMVVAFVAPWCSKCKEMLPIWEEMAESMQNEQDQDVFIAKVDCVAEPDMYYKEDIQYFPTIKTFVNYNAMSIEYDGERKANTMWRYLRLMHEQYVNEVFSITEFQEIQSMKLNENRPLVLAVVAPDDDLSDASDMNRKVDAACKKADRVRCYFARNPEFVEQLGLSVNSLTLFSSFNGDKQIDNSVRLSDANLNSALEMSNWIMENAYPPVVELTHLNDKLIFSEQRPGFQNHFLFLLKDAKSDEGVATLATLKTAAAASIGKCVFIYVDLATLSDNNYASGVLSSLNADQTVSKAYSVTSKKPFIRFYSGLEGKLNDVSAIKVWVDGVLSGTVENDREIETE
jgi:thiol-disulfide isomerase/thioredoxin